MYHIYNYWMNKSIKLSQQNIATCCIHKFINQRYSRNRTLLNVAFEGSYKRNEYIQQLTNDQNLVFGSTCSCMNTRFWKKKSLKNKKSVDVKIVIWLTCKMTVESTDTPTYTPWRYCICMFFCEMKKPNVTITLTCTIYW